MNSPDVQVVQREMAPRLAAFSDQITQNEALFKRIEAVYNSPGESAAHCRATAADLVVLHELSFVPARGWRRTRRRGSLRSINNWPGSTPKFGQNVLAEEDGQFIVLKGEADLAGSAAICARCGGGRGRNQKANGRLGDHEHAFLRRSVSDLL